MLEPIFEADLQEEQYAYRKGRGAQEAVTRVHKLVNTGYRHVVDADLSNYFGEIPHDKMMKSLARRISDGRMLGLIKSWLVMPVEQDNHPQCNNLATIAKSTGVAHHQEAMQRIISRVARSTSRTYRVDG